MNPTNEQAQELDASKRRQEKRREDIARWGSDYSIGTITLDDFDTLLAALSSRDAEIREVLEGLLTRRWFGDKPTTCWCDPHFYPDTDEDKDHNTRCQRARELYKKAGGEL